MTSARQPPPDHALFTDGTRLVEMLGVDGTGKYVFGNCGREPAVFCVNPDELGRTWVTPQEWSARRDAAA